jgi:hypothetical protein
MAVRRFLPFLLLVVLGGCFSDQKARLAACENDAARALPRPPPGEPFKTILACMDRGGYRFIGWNENVTCDMGAVVKGRPSATGAGALCFEPKGWLALRVYRIEVPLKAPRRASS